MRPALHVLFILLVATAGCADTPPPDTPTKTTERTPTKTTVPSELLSNQTAKDRALDAEDRRVSRILANNTNVTAWSVPGYNEPRASVLDRSAEGVIVRIIMPYDFGYTCEFEAATVDGVTTRTTYLVTPTETTLRAVDEPVARPCAPDSATSYASDPDPVVLRE